MILALGGLVLFLVAVGVAFRWASPLPYDLLASTDAELLRLSPVPIASAPDSGLVACSGVVHAVPGARLPTTLSGEAAVWVEGVVETAEYQGDEYEHARRRLIRRWPVLAFVDSVPFLIDDGSGEQAQVLPVRGQLLPTLSESRILEVDAETAPRVLDLLVRYNKAIDARMPLFYGEISVAPGDTVTVQGAARRGAGGEQRSLLLAAGSAGDDGLIVRRG